MASKMAPKINAYPFWAPRFWHSMLLTDWLKLIARHGFRVHPSRWGIAIGASITAAFNSKMRIAQLALFGHQLKKNALPEDPIFILGHWRSGTTFLHELLALDQRFLTPTTYQCFAANHFVLTEAVITRLLWFLIPSRRPMDNMAAGWHEPQEDEFGLCAKGVPSPYLRIAFPNDDQEYLDYLDMQLSPSEVSAWKDGFSSFLKSLAIRGQRRMVLKSPTHTGRLELLADMFPRAKFIHIARNPYDVVPSTIRLWKSLEYVQSLQMPRYQHLPDYVFRAYRRMYDGYFQSRDRIEPDRLMEITYESLVDDPPKVMAQLYQQLELGDFETVRDRLMDNLETRKNYQKNKHELDAALITQINDHWADYFEQFGYQTRT